MRSWKTIASCALVAAAGHSSALAQSDSCAGASEVVPGIIYSGNTDGASNDGVGTCGNSELSHDVWFKITPTEDRFLSATTCQGASYDTVLSIHSGCPGTAANELSCNDDSCDLTSTTQANVLAGQTYYIRVAGYGGATGSFSFEVSLQDPPPAPSVGPDVYVGDLIDIGWYGAQGPITAYSVGTNACNSGDFPVQWTASNNRHPVIAQNFYRLKAGRFEQIGQSWLKHGFSSTNSDFCGVCQDPPGGGSQLGVNCSDAYGAGLNGSQGYLGPRSQVNSTTGEYPYPFTAPPAAVTIGRRLQVKTLDMYPPNNPGAIYFAEAQYITADDATWNNGLNNLSYRRMTVTNVTQPPNWSGATIRNQPAIQAWPLLDPTVTLIAADYQVGNITARFWLGTKVVNNGNGTWDYEYAIHNINSDRAGGSFSIPIPAGVTVTNPGFHDVDSHSGEPYDLTDWTPVITPGLISWTTSQSFAQNPNANALRWGTLYNFRFTASVGPGPGGAATLGLFTPGTPTNLIVGVPVPGEPPCPADFNHDGEAGTDVDIMDFFAALGGNRCATCGSADYNADGDVGTDTDIEAFFRVMGGGAC